MHPSSTEEAKAYFEDTPVKEESPEKARFGSMVEQLLKGRRKGVRKRLKLDGLYGESIVEITSG